jgi:hypothetical protein
MVILVLIATWGFGRRRRQSLNRGLRFSIQGGGALWPSRKFRDAWFCEGFVAISGHPVQLGARQFTIDLDTPDPLVGERLPKAERSAVRVNKNETHGVKV